jgi:uncharacterized protein (TIGR02246 family)
MHMARIATLFALCACSHRVDVASERKALLDADAQFAKDTAERGAEAWASWFAEDGVMYPPGQAPVQGRDKIRELMSDLRDPRTGRGDLQIDWAPVTADVSSAGDLGWTYGTSRIITPRGERLGKYLSVWRKQADGSWRVAADIGNSTAAPPAQKSPP